MRDGEETIRGLKFDPKMRWVREGGRKSTVMLNEKLNSRKISPAGSESTDWLKLLPRDR